MDVGDFLRELGLQQYEATFRENDVDAELLPNLGADDLKELGITSLGQFRWLGTNAEFRDKYARAREVQGHIAADLAVEVAVNATDAGLGRLAYDARKWQASKLAPKVYGDKSEVVMSGPNGGAIQNETKLSLDPMEAMRAYQRMMGEDK
jgi:SAM domain (Sterile alpha motif)